MNTSDNCQESCAICKKDIVEGDTSNLSKLFKKGADKINESSRKRGRDDVLVREGERVHSDCRKLYTNEGDIQRTLKRSREQSPPNRKKSVRVSTGPYNCRTDCLFCGRTISEETHGRSSNKGSEVKTDTLPQSILACCEERSDAWSFIVKGRIEYFAKDLHAAECIYHRQCSVNFRIGRRMPNQFKDQSLPRWRNPGRPTNEDQQQAFQRVCTYLEENDEEQLTISDLVSKMSGYLLDKESVPYGNQYLKDKLKAQYGDAMCIAEREGVHDIVTMREKTSQILHAYFKSDKGSDEESQKRSIIDTAARLIKFDIKSSVPSITDVYPSSSDLKIEAALNYLPSSLRLLLTSLFVGTRKHEKVAAIGQSIIQAVRPRAVVAPLQIGLASQVHHLYRSRFLVDTLSAMGFGSSYGEVQRFEKNAAELVAPDVLGEGQCGMVLFAADNVDHNILTLDGKGTFHGMGMIAAITPERKTNHLVPRQKVSVLHVTEQSKIDIVDYRFSNYARKHIKFHELADIHCTTLTIDIFWELSLRFHQTTPNWQGMMHTIHCDEKHPGKSSVTFLPMIDMYPGDHTCILSTLSYICSLAYRHDISPVVTFDQPLFWKASEIICNAPQGSPLRDIVLMLGPFHTFMNLLGAIGTLMQGSGLSDILETVYGENAVKQMLNGKSVQRAFRGHLLVEKCLKGMIVSGICDSDPEFDELVKKYEDLYISVVEGECTVDSLETSDLKLKIEKFMRHREQQLSDRSRTSKLWLCYLGMVRIGRSLIRADRSGSWETHLCAIAECLPIFAAAGHYNYLKSAYLYLQNMQQLEITNPTVYMKFQAGYYVIRRTDQFWAGLGSDLVIEQTLMRSLKSTGGLTRGSGMTEEQRALWTLSSPVCCEYNVAMQEFSKCSFTSSEQHKEATTSRIDRDQSDLAKIQDKLQLYTPFSADPALRNIVTGVVAKDDVNVDNFQEVEKEVVEKLVGQPVFTYTCRRKDKVKTLGDSSTVKVAGDRSIDPALLFQRLLVISQTGSPSLEDVLEYELSPFPPALFESKHIFRKADKPQLAKAIDEYARGLSAEEMSADEVPKTDHIVLDGGSLMHRVKWTKGNTYGSIADDYSSFVVQRYGKATVVFDGYSDKPSIKDSTHQRRQMTNHPKVNFTADTVFMGKQDEFLSHGSNKQELINSISQRLKEKGCSVTNATSDADYDIVRAAVQASELQSTTLIGEDTDLLILLLHHSVQDSKDLYFRSDKSQGKHRVYDINKLRGILGRQSCTLTLFAHAFSGCDTTSRIFGVGKKSVFQKVMSGHSSLRSYATEFTIPGQSCDAVVELGRKAMVQVFGGKSTDTLKSMRHSILAKKVVSAVSFVAPERLPPTEAATKQHSLRVYYQIMAWMGEEKDLDATEWGWEVKDQLFIPVMTEMSAAPDCLLKVVHCNCTTGCSTQRCTCKSYGLPCTSACGQCQLQSCSNPSNQLAANDDDEL